MNEHVHAAFNGFLTTCPGCGEDYVAETVSEAQDPDRLCPPCFEAWPGMTMEELLR